MKQDESFYTPEEREKILEDMKKLRENCYWMFFHQGMGQKAHAFLEFNGLISKYVDLCVRAHEQGVDFTNANTHNGKALPMEGHDADYLAEKFDCIFGPALRANPEAAAIFLETVFGIESPHFPKFGDREKEMFGEDIVNQAADEQLMEVLDRIESCNNCGTRKGHLHSEGCEDSTRCTHTDQALRCARWEGHPVGRKEGHLMVAKGREAHPD